MRRIPPVAIGLALSISLLNVSAAHAAPIHSTPTQLTATAAAPSQVQSAVIKTRTIVTTFYTDAQLTTILKKTAEDMYANKSVQQSFTTPFPLYALDVSRQLALVQLTANLMKDLGSTVVLDKVHAASLRSVAPSYEAIRTQVQACKAAGKAKSVCLDMAYAGIGQQLTKTRVHTALLNVKKSLTAKEWQSFRSHGAALFQWSVYGL